MLNRKVRARNPQLLIAEDRYLQALRQNTVQIEKPFDYPTINRTLLKKSKKDLGFQNTTKIPTK